MFEKRQLLGAGSNGTVFLAKNISSSSDSSVCAVKTTDLQDAYPMRVEGECLQALRASPFVIRGYGDDISLEHGKHVYNLLLEYAPGGTLHDLIKSRGNIPESEISWYTYQILKGLQDVHSHGIVHCDMKPENVLVFLGRRGNRLKLADFGLAKTTGTDIFGDCHRGTPTYSSPESLLYGEYAAPKDIWAVGCMVVEMITGTNVWSWCRNEDEIQWNIELTKPEIPNGVSIRARDFIKKCFKRDPAMRWTAHKLLTHPFIANGINEFTQLNEEAENPFGSGGWYSGRDLFSRTSIPRHRLSIPPGFHLPAFISKKSKEDSSVSRPAAPSSFLVLGH